MRVAQRALIDHWKQYSSTEYRRAVTKIAARKKQHYH